MKFRVLMKDPDVLNDAIRDAVGETLSGIEDNEEREAVREVREAKAGDVASKWFEYGEYLNVEIDTEACTCTVIPVGK